MDRAALVRPPSWIVAVAAIALVKLVWLAVDPTLRLFMGDSASYLHYAAIDQPPPDRSFTYPLLIRATALASGSATTLLAVQALFGLATAALLYALLRSAAGLAAAPALLLSLLLATEPAQLFYERMVMAESAGTLCFLATLACGFAYLRRPHPGWLLAAAVCGVATVSLRLSLLPVVLGLAPLPPLVRAFATRGTAASRGWLRAGAAALVAVVATLAAHEGYKRWYDLRSDVERRVDYIHTSGFMRIGLVAPLIRPHHLDGLGLPANLLDEVEVPLDDRRGREAQIWVPGGLVSVLQRHAGPEANRIARKITMRAFRDDPLGLVRLGIATLGDYFVDPVALDRLWDDLGRRPAGEGTLTLLRERLRYDAAGVENTPSPAYRAFAASRAWLTTCLFALPVLAALLLLRHRREPREGQALLLALALLGLFLAQLLFAHIVSFRYLHPLPPVVLLAVGLLAARRPAAPPAA